MNPEISNLMATTFDESDLDLDKPQWLEGNVINEVIFADEYLRANPMKRIRGKLFTVDGPVEDEESIRSDIYNVICNHVSTGTPRRASSLLEAIKLACYSEPLPLQEDRIHVANGTYFLDGRFTTEKSFCTNRLAVEYAPDAPRPEQWLNFLSELLYEEDIPSLQEYIGYLMIPSTRAQRMMMLIGQGGEGKSRIGCVLRAMFGDSMSVGSLHKVETNKFARADLEFKLLLVDDDLPMEALPQTNNLKTLVTNEGKTDIERKGEQSVQRDIYARFLCFGNGVLKAKNDSSYAFYRRQLLIDVKERDHDRVDDVFLADRLKEELASKDSFDWYLRFEGDPDSPLRCKVEGKRRSTTKITVAGASSPAMDNSATGCYKGQQEIRTRPTNAIGDCERVPRNLVADAIRTEPAKQVGETWFMFAQFTLTKEDAKRYLYQSSTKQPVHNWDNITVRLFI